MPDRAEVEQALAAEIASALYPNGAESDSVVGVVCRIYRGWPVSGALEADLARGMAQITVQPMAGSFRNTTRYSAEWQGEPPEATLTVSVDDDTVTFDGAPASGQAVGVLVDGLTYVYRVQPGDTPEMVASSVASLIAPNREADTYDAMVSIPNARGLLARVVSDGQGGRELRRQVAGFRVTLWCPDPGVRDLVAGVVDLALADQVFMDVGGWDCRLRCSGGSSTDASSEAGVWRRDLIYSIEYPTTTSEALPAMLFGVADVNGVPFDA